ncbi:MAG: sulfatase-like hydrolase/transferase [Thermoanaerobaculia bacterium]
MVGGGQLHPQYGFGKGFDSYELARTEKGTRGLSVLEKKALDWLRENAQKRFFLFLHTYQMHAPYAPPEEYWKQYAGWYRGSLDPRDKRKAGHFREAGLGDEEVRFLRDLYAADVAYVDSFLGRLLQKLKDLEIYESTMIVLLSDHGESLGERGRFGHNQLYDVQIRVPLIIHIPGLTPLKVDKPVETIDVMPTIFAVLGLRPPFDFQGESLLSLMRGQPQSWKKEYRIAQQGKRVAVQRGPWKLRFRLNREGANRLLHLATDPKEVANFAAVFPEKVTEFKEYYRETMAQAQELESRFVITTASNPTRDENVRRQLKALGYIE